MRVRSFPPAPTGMRAGSLVGLSLLAFPMIALAQDGWFGFSQSVEVGWSFKVESAIVNDVQKDSPAERAGITVGDAFVSIEDCAIPGCGAFKAKKLMEKAAGERLQLKLRRKSGEEYAITLVAARPPARATVPGAAQGDGPPRGPRS